MSTISKLLATAALFICSVATADLYTGHVASLEWKTHSSDAVLLVSVDSRLSDAAVVTLVKDFCRPADVFTNAESVAQSWKPPLQTNYQKDWRPDGEWLLFVRTWEHSEPTIDHVVYLENPLQASWMSAVNAKGQQLVEKQAILAVVKSRLGNGEMMTSRQRRARRLVDSGVQQPKSLTRSYPTHTNDAPFCDRVFLEINLVALEASDDELVDLVLKTATGSLS